MRVKSRKPLAENSMTSDLRLSSRFGRGADDRVGDQMRQMRGHRQHLVVVVGAHRDDPHAEPLPHPADRGDRLGRRSRAAASGCTSGRGTARQSRIPVRNARCRRPGGRERNGRRSGHAGRRSRITACLTEPTSVRIAPSLQRRRDPLADFGIGGERRRDHHEIGARDRLGRVVGRLVGNRRAAAPPPSVSARRAQATMRCPGLSRRSARASEDPISPIPISATRSNSLRSVARSGSVSPAKPMNSARCATTARHRAPYRECTVPFGRCRS